MLKNSRVSGSIDMSRLANGLRGPGMDTRTWVSLAIVTAVVIDPDEGVFVDVTLMPSRKRETARLGSAYAGAGFGLYAPVEVDDEVIVVAPSGDPDHGLILSNRLHSASDPPSGDFSSHPEDVILMVKPGKNVRLITTGGGNVVLEARGDGEVRLGSPGAQGGCARVGDSVVLSGVGVADLQALMDARYQLRPSPPPLPIPSGQTVGTISSGSDKVKVA